MTVKSALAALRRPLRSRLPAEARLGRRREGARTQGCPPRTLRTPCRWPSRRG
jgi:hypothetical protein